MTAIGMGIRTNAGKIKQFASPTTLYIKKAGRPPSYKPQKKYRKGKLTTLCIIGKTISREQNKVMTDKPPSQVKILLNEIVITDVEQSDGVRNKK